MLSIHLGRWAIVLAGATLLFSNAFAGTLPEVSVTQGISQTSEAGGSAATFTFSRTGSTSQQLLVYFEPVTGSEAANSDWSSDEIRNLGSGRRGIIFPEDVSTYEAEIVAIPDNMVEGAESLLQSLMPRSTYTIASGSEATFDTTLVDDPPAVTIELTHDSIIEGGSPGAMTLARSGGDTSVQLGVQVFFNAGTASVGPDFVVEGETPTPQRLIIIDANQTSETRAVTPQMDNEVEGDETITFEIRPSTSSSSNYIITNDTDSITLFDDVAEVSIASLDPDASESGDPGVFRISRTGGDIDSQLIVYLDRSGTAAAPGQVPRDYDMDLSQNANGRFILIPAQAAMFDILVEPLFDSDEGEDDETVILTIRDDIGEYVVDMTQQTATVTIQNVPELVFASGFEPPTAKACVSNKDYRRDFWRYHTTSDGIVDLILGELVSPCAD